MDRKRKSSGWQNKQNREKRLTEQSKKQKTMHSFLQDGQNKDNSAKPVAPMDTNDLGHDDTIIIDEGPGAENDETYVHFVSNTVTSEAKQDYGISIVEMSECEPLNSDVETSAVETTDCYNFDDIADWPENLQNFQIEKIIFKGPIRANNNHYPKDVVGRSFNKIYFQRKPANGELVDRTWLVYSSKLNRVFCFCCKIFSSDEFAPAKAGTNDWRHMTSILKRHERCTEHFNCYEKWIELKKRFSTGQTVDSLSNKLYLSEVEHWDQLPKRIISIILTMASENIAFRAVVGNRRLRARKLAAPFIIQHFS
jgi:hypothetical protein